MKPTYHIISHSHWDREWYFPFDRFRAMLVDMVEDLIDLFEKNPDFKCYTLDGQVAAVMDYLEIRPDRRETIQKLVQDRKLFIGPWYILNDEFLSSGESHIRNLSLGFRLGRNLGGAMRVGYIPDQFGHIAQMPQILQGFGIDTAIIYRGFGGEPGQEPSEYTWVSPDGTCVLMHHLPKDGYSAGYFGVSNKEGILQKFERLRRELDARGTTSQRLFFNGGDHHWPDANVTTAMNVLREQYDADFKHSNFPDFFAAVKRELAAKSPLSRLEGEARFGYRHAFAVLGGVFSSRMYLKQLNAECEMMLERYLEPLNVLATLAGMRSRTPQIEQAWKYVLQNQDHDAICGTSVDEVHREMVVRYAKARQVGEHVKAECLSQLLPYDERKYRDDRYVFVVNLSPYQRSDVVEAKVEFFLQDVVVGLNPEVRVDEKLPPVKGFRLLDPDGDEIPFQILRRKESFGVTYSKQDYPHQTLVDQFSVLLSADAVPALGWRGLKVERTEEMPRYTSEVQSSTTSIENEFIKVEATVDGTVRMTDKTSGEIFDDINFFEDSGDVGDEYTYSYPLKDEWYSSHQFSPKLSVVEHGPVRAALRLDHRMAVPERASDDGRTRSVNKVELSISTIFTLTKRSRRVDIKTTVRNLSKDHRLRALFATGIDTTESYAETPFAVVKRRHQSYDVKEFPYEHPAMVAPMQRFVSIGGKKKGLTLITRGLPEYELKLDQQGVLALTLLRCVGKLSGRDLITRPGGAAGWWNETPEAQCPGDHTFEYSLMPHASLGETIWPSILREVEQYTVPFMVVSRKNEQQVLKRTAFSVQPEVLLLSALKTADDGAGIIVRVHNPIDAVVKGAVRCESPVRRAIRVKMNEDVIGPIEVRNNHEVHFEIRPFEVVSIRLTF